MEKKRTGKLVIEIGFKFGGETSPIIELEALRENLRSNQPDFSKPLPKDSTKRDRISEHVYDFFKEINIEKDFKTMDPYYNFYHVLEDPDDRE